MSAMTAPGRHEPMLSGGHLALTPEPSGALKTTLSAVLNCSFIRTAGADVCQTNFSIPVQARYPTIFSDSATISKFCNKEGSMTIYRPLWLLTLCLLLSACDQFSPTTALESRVRVAEANFEKAEADMAALQAQVAALKQKREFDDLMQDIDKIAYLTPGADGYSTIGFDLGVLTVQLSDVKPYANGSKVTLRFGNTLSSSINGLRATIEWGKVSDKGLPDFDNEKSKDMAFVETLRGGAWTPISVVLDGIPPTDLGFVRVSKVSHTGIQLFK